MHIEDGWLFGDMNASGIVVDVDIVDKIVAEMPGLVPMFDAMVVVAAAVA